MAYADALLEQAGQLLALDPRRPRQVNLRRAVSATYYALFHRLISDATSEFAGSSAEALPIRQAISRWFVHRRMAEVARWFARPLAMRKGPLRSLLVDDASNPPIIRVSEQLVEVAGAFAHSKKSAIRRTTTLQKGTRVRPQVLCESRAPRV